MHSDCFGTVSQIMDRKNLVEGIYDALGAAGIGEFASYDWLHGLAEHIALFAEREAAVWLSFDTPSGKPKEYKPKIPYVDKKKS